jgi:hypothetical protein
MGSEPLTSSSIEGRTLEEMPAKKTQASRSTLTGFLVGGIHSATSTGFVDLPVSQTCAVA